MKNLILLLFLFIAAVSFSGCKSINDVERFDPQFHIGDYEKGVIKNRVGEEVSCHEVRFNEFACMHSEKIKELNRILSRYRRRVPTSSLEINQLIKELDEANVR